MDETCECRYCGVEYRRKNYRPWSACEPCAHERASYRHQSDKAGEEGRKMYLSRWFPERYAPEAFRVSPEDVRAVFEERYGPVFRELAEFYRLRRAHAP